MKDAQNTLHTQSPETSAVQGDRRRIATWDAIYLLSAIESHLCSFMGFRGAFVGGRAVAIANISNDFDLLLSVTHYLPERAALREAYDGVEEALLNRFDQKPLQKLVAQLQAAQERMRARVGCADESQLPGDRIVDNNGEHWRRERISRQSRTPRR